MSKEQMEKEIAALKAKVAELEKKLALISASHSMSQVRRLAVQLDVKGKDE